MKNLSLVITPGDPEGVGPEVTAKALSKLAPKLKSWDVVIFGAQKPFQKHKSLIKKAAPVFFEPPTRSSPGYQSGWAIDAATQFMLASPKKRVLVTGPISKERLQAAGYQYNGHTDFLAALSGTPQVTMMLANEFFSVVLATDHCPLKLVSKNLHPKNILQTLAHAYEFSKNLQKKRRPRIAILGLNPHAGENGLLGNEEKDILIPVMKAFSDKFPDAVLNGPLSADSFFAVELKKKPAERHDVILAMYHDQGLIPVKLSGFSKSINMTLGLPFIRTSVDHGTAFNIAGKNKADPGSMIYAITRAIQYSGAKI